MALNMHTNLPLPGGRGNAEKLAKRAQASCPKWQNCGLFCQNTPVAETATTGSCPIRKSLIYSDYRVADPLVKVPHSLSLGFSLLEVVVNQRSDAKWPTQALMSENPATQSRKCQVKPYSTPGCVGWMKARPPIVAVSTSQSDRPSGQLVRRGRRCPSRTNALAATPRRLNLYA